MPASPNEPPSLAAAFEIANQMQRGLAGQGRAQDLRTYLRRAQEWIEMMARQQERELEPQVLADINAMFQALRDARIDGTIRMIIAPPGGDLPGQYSVETEFGKLTGEAAQLANTILLLGQATGMRREPPSPPEEDGWEPPTDEPAEASRSIH